MALSPPRRDGAHAPAPRSSPEVARALGLHQLPPRHTHRRRGPGRRHVVLPSGGPAHAPAARHTVEVARGRGRRRRPGAHAEGRGWRGRGDARSHPRGDADGRCWRGCYRGRRALRLLPPCLWPPTRLRRRDGAECRPRGVQHGAVRAAGGCRACSSFIISKEGGKGVASQLVKNLVETSHLSTLAFSGSIL